MTPDQPATDPGNSTAAAPQQKGRRTTKLTPRQQRFIDEYLLDFNGTQAAIRAGYSVNGADVQAVQLLGNPSVKAVVDRRIAARVNRLQVKQDDVVRELLRIAMADPARAFDKKTGALKSIHKMPKDIRRGRQGARLAQRRVVLRTAKPRDPCLLAGPSSSARDSSWHPKSGDDAVARFE